MGNDYFAEVFAENLRKYMKIYNLTPADIERRLNVSQPTVSYWLAGAKLPRMDKIQKLTEIFNCKNSDLLERSSKSSQTKRELIEFIESMSEEQASALLAFLKNK